MFFVRIEQTSPVPPHDSVVEYDPENDNIVSLLSDVSETLERSGRIRFLSGGFGDDAWPTDVRTDLAVVMEQVPGVLRTVRTGLPARLDFYEQGLERSVAIVPRMDRVELACTGTGRWLPKHPVEQAVTREFIAMLERLLAHFLKLVEEARPRLRAHPWLEEWLHDAEVPLASEEVNDE